MIQESLALLHLVREDFWESCFAQASALALTRDGHYNPEEDRDLILSYCMA